DERAVHPFDLFPRRDVGDAVAQHRARLAEHGVDALLVEHDALRCIALGVAPFAAHEPLGGAPRNRAEPALVGVVRLVNRRRDGLDVPVAVHFTRRNFAEVPTYTDDCPGSIWRPPPCPNTSISHHRPATRSRCATAHCPSPPSPSFPSSRATAPVPISGTRRNWCSTARSAKRTAASGALRGT